MPFPQAAQNVAFALLFLTLVATGFLKARYFLFVAGLAIPLVLPRMVVGGIGLDWYKLIGPIAIALMIFARARGVGFVRTRASVFHWLLAYAVVLSAVWMVAEYNWLQRWRVAAALELGGGLAQTYFKMPVQLGSFVGQALCLYAVPAFARTEDDTRAAYLGYVTGCGLSALAGVAGLAIGAGGTVNRPGGDEFDLTGAATRLGGLGGEPKFFGAYLAVLVAFALAQLIFGARTDARLSRWILLGAGTFVFMTRSTSAWVATVAAVGVTAALTLRHWRPSRVLVIVGLVGGFLVLASTVAFVSTVVQNRFVNRLQERVLRKQKDAYVLSLYADEPTSAIFGYGCGGGDLAVIPYIDWLHLQYKRTPTPGVTLIRLWADLGTVGLLILALIGLSWKRRLSRQGDAASGIFILSGMAAAMLCSAMGLSGYFFLAGAALARGELRAAERAGSGELAVDGRRTPGQRRLPPRLPAAARS